MGYEALLRGGQERTKNDKNVNGRLRLSIRFIYVRLYRRFA